MKLILFVLLNEACTLDGHAFNSVNVCVVLSGSFDVQVYQKLNKLQ